MSPISGSGFKNFFRLLKGNEISFKYYPKLLLFVLFVVFVEPFRWLERRFQKKKLEEYKIKEDPVFIVGHWRSGTTFLHNVICEDPQMGFVTLYQGIYPETVFKGTWLVKNMMKLLMPKTRASDNMELGTDLPQEEEFALSNTHSMSYYNFWFFPKRWKDFFRKYIEFDIPESIKSKWKNEYRNLIKKALINTNGKRFISKNPPNTGRIDVLLELFPNARFIHIYRDPITTFVSSKKFFESTIQPLKLHSISEEELDENILWTFDKLMNRFEDQKRLIPKENLIEIKFEEFEKDTIGGIQNIYEKLRLPGFEIARPHFEEYVSGQKDYQKNEHKIPQKLKNRITSRWGFAIKRWNYDNAQKDKKEEKRLQMV